MQELQQMMHKEQPLVNEVLAQALATVPSLAKPIVSHVLLAGGKRLRPLLCLLTGRTLGLQHNDLYTLGVAVEMLHAATLLHDDVLDNAATRRGQPAAHTIFPPSDVILAGDVLLAKSLHMVALLGDAQLVAVISEAVWQTAEGELAEFSVIRDTSLTHERYLEIIRGKTAWMLRAACELGAIRAGASTEQVAAAARFGMELGTAFQMVDDALDFAPESQTGKPCGGDLREGKITPPLLLYAQSLDAAERRTVLDAFAAGSLREDELTRIGAVIYEKGFAQQAIALSEVHLNNAAEALALLPARPERDILAQMLVYIRSRSH